MNKNRKGPPMNDARNRELHTAAARPREGAGYFDGAGKTFRPLRDPRRLLPPGTPYVHPGWSNAERAAVGLPAR